MEGNTAFYEHSLKLLEGLSQMLNYNVMFSQRGRLNLFFTPAQRDALARRYNIMRLNGIDGEFLSRDQVQKMVPHLNYAEESRFPIMGGFLQPRAITARHDAVNWGYARAASALGVDIIQNCEVTGFIHQGGRIMGVETSRGNTGGKNRDGRSRIDLAIGKDGRAWQIADRKPQAAGLCL